MTESLFDNKFIADSNMATENSNLDDQIINNHTETTPIAEDHDEELVVGGDKSSLPEVTESSTLINYRVLVSAKEAGCLIGQNGKVIDSIRIETNTKAGISKLQQGSHERILTVSGTLDDCSKALSYFSQALCSSLNNVSTYNYMYFPLKRLSPQPCIPGETTILRLLIPNSQMGTLIGQKGIRIQQIQQNYHISMIASKSFLPGSNERLVELQGTVDNLYDALRVISRCLIEDFSSIVNTNYYVPKGSAVNAKNGTTPNKKQSTTMSFPNDIVGALIGKSGTRIQGVRKLSGAQIAIGDEVEGEANRVFTITGSPRAVEKAVELLNHNLDREEQRRKNATAPA
ncbi:RNA binding protein, heterogenous nuclear RNP-K like protein [Scheffersomyces spartinae]|uniref:RNA binding protein, heterogenous nuclear RNP-K like protein n=1 Tax=Scheffersomyces spartinae TaxID=45513 RepID=A0A9P7V6M0_9ASCO|nr:RNA binding protein, heterogenous nuclear RNP-K like protein [Scheffersomyces spartinae]KAG7192187.1 RNA binding protein, heterogenous nuclear RNP-K like protein [Scheffersomyces spartinae]